MANISTLSVTLNANTRGFSEGMKKAQNDLKGLVGVMTGVAVKISKLSAGLLAAAGAGGTGGLGLAMARLIRLGREFRRAIPRLGLYTDQIQTLRFAAKQLGIDHRDLERNLIAFARASGGTATPVKQFAQALKFLGINTKKYVLFQKQLQDLGGLISSGDLMKIQTAEISLTNLGIALRKFTNNAAIAVSIPLSVLVDDLTLLISKKDGILNLSDAIDTLAIALGVMNDKAISAFEELQRLTGVGLGGLGGFVAEKLAFFFKERAAQAKSPKGARIFGLIEALEHWSEVGKELARENLEALEERERKGPETKFEDIMLRAVKRWREVREQMAKEAKNRERQLLERFPDFGFKLAQSIGAAFRARFGRELGFTGVTQAQRAPLLATTGRIETQQLSQLKAINTTLKQIKNQQKGLGP